MKKFRLISLLMLMASFFILGGQTQAAEYITDPSDLPKADAYKAIVKIYTFAEDEDYSLDLLGSGSGIVIDPSGIVLTNYHVVTLTDEFNEGEYPTTFQICIADSISEEPSCDYVGQLINKDKDKDLALLQIKNIPSLTSKNSNFNYLNIAATDQNEVNDEVIVMGYPSIGGNTITITKGIVSGKETKYSNNWLKTDAVISFGSSGGAAINMDGQVIGVTTQAHSDLAGTVGYLINSDSIYEWVNTYKNMAPRSSDLLSRLEAFTILERDLETSNTFSHKYFEVTKPDDWTFVYINENLIGIHKQGDDDGGYFAAAVAKWPHEASLDMVLTHIKKNMLDEAPLSLFNLNKDESVTFNNNVGEKIVYTVLGESNSGEYFATQDAIIYLVHDNGLNSKDKAQVDSILNSLQIKKPAVTYSNLSSYTNDYPQFSVASKNGWMIMDKALKSKPVILYNQNYPNAYMEIAVSQPGETLQSFTNEEYAEYLDNLMDTVRSAGGVLDLSVVTHENDPHSILNGQLSDTVFYDFSMLKVSSGEQLVRAKEYGVRSGNKYITVTLVVYGDENYEAISNSAQAVMESFSLSTTPYSGTQTQTQQQQQQQTNTQTNTQTQTQTGSQTQTQQQQKQPSPAATGPLSTRLRGRILLQVEQHGEAWYVKPEDGQRVYMKDGETAYQMMRGLGLGITDENLAKIPVGIESRFAELDSDGDGLGDRLEEGLKTDPYNADTDGDGYNDGDEVLGGYNPLGTGALNYDYNLGQQVKGKILLQVESRGEAWYINPEDGKRYYMSDGEAAYQIMRYLSLGITDNDLSQIPSTDL